MRKKHFEHLKPICPVCVDIANHFESKLCIECATIELGEHIVEGVLRCTNPPCQSEFPIIDGIPIIHPQLRSYITDNFFHIHARHDLTETMESLLGDCCSQGSPFDMTRQHLSCYAWDHYADCDPNEDASGQSIRSGSVVRLLDQGLRTGASFDNGPVLDIGCGVGRTTFELATRTQELVLGIDIHFSMLRLAAMALRTGIVRYPRRRVGLVYDRREFEVRFKNSVNVDFWACDATCLPFSGSLFGQCTAMNVLDSVAAPHGFIKSMARVLKPSGRALMGCPYDWTTSVTPVEAWLGGHSQRSTQQGESGHQLRALFTDRNHPSYVEELEIDGETEQFPWNTKTP